MGNEGIVTVSCASVDNGKLAECLVSDVLPELEHNFIGTEILRETISRLRKMQCPEGITPRRAYDQQR